MAIGAVQSVVVCAPLAAGPSVAPCSDIGGVSYGPQVQQAYLVTPDGGAALEAAAEPLDVSVASGFWAFGFVGVVGLWFLGKSARTVLKSVGILF